MLLNEYGNLLKAYIEIFQCAQLWRIWGQNYAFMNVYAQYNWQRMYVWPPYKTRRDSWMYSFSHISCINHRKKDAKPETSRSYVSSLFNIAPGLPFVFARCFKRIETSRYRWIPKESSMHLPEEDTGHTHVPRKVWEKNPFSATRSNKYFSSGTKPAIRPVRVSRRPRDNIGIVVETTQDLSLWRDPFLRLYRPVTDMHAFVRVYIERVRTHGWTAKLPPEVGVGIHLIDDVTLWEWSHGGCWSVDVNPKFSNVTLWDTYPLRAHTV